MIHFIILVCFFCSGAAALTYEVVCSRLLVHVFGATLYATATVLAVFMGGLSAGALAAGRRMDRLGNPLRVYAWLELGIGLFGLLLILVFSQHVLTGAWAIIAVLVGGRPWLMTIARLSFCAIVLAAPTVLIGATLPTLTRFVAATGRELHKAVNYLYVVNTAGAVAGTIGSGFVLMPHLGLALSLLVAAAVNLLISVAVFLSGRLVGAGMMEASGGDKCGRRTKEVLDATPPRPSTTAGASGTAEPSTGLPLWAVTTVLVLVGISGALSMMLEVAWTRFFSLIFDSSTYAFCTMLSVFLIGIAGGAWLGSHLLPRLRAVLPVMAALQAAAGLYLYGSLFFAGSLSSWFFQIERAIGGGGAVTFSAALGARALVSALVMLPPTVVLGALFPLAVGAVISSRKSAAFGAGRLYAVNTAGCIAGSLLGGFVLIPYLSRRFVSGIQMVLLVESAGGLALAVVLFAIWRPASESGLRGRLGLCVLAAAVIVGLAPVLGAWLPPWNPAAMTSGIAPGPAAGKSRACILFYQEGLNSTVTVGIEPPANIIYLKSNSQVEVSVPLNPSRSAPASDFPTQVLLGVLPVLLHDGPVQDALVIGYGSGTTCGAILADHEPSTLSIAELEEAVVRADPFFSQVNNHPLRDDWRRSGRVKLLLQDGRYVLATAPDKYDLIVSQPAEPWVSGSADLFTQEFWNLSKLRLKDGGLFCQWVQLYGVTPEYLAVICRTFIATYPNTVVFHPNRAGEVLLVGWAGRIAVNPRSLAARFHDQAIRGRLFKAGVKRPEDLVSMILAGPADLRAFCNDVAGRTGDHRLSTDDNLVLEYELPKALYGASDETLIQHNLDTLSATGVGRLRPLPELAPLWQSKR